MILDIWFYLGDIISQAGMAILAIGLVLVRVFDFDITERLKWEKRFAMVAFTLLILGISMKLLKLFSE